MYESINYKKRDNQLVQCNTCSHFCEIQPGNVGVCAVRKNIQGKLELLVYGQAAAANIDPVEKKPLFHFYPGSQTFSVGTLGCNFRCDNCQNYEISQIDKLKLEQSLQNYGIAISAQEIVDRALNGNCKSIAYTYNEPTIFLEYALDIMKLARKKGLKNIWVSNGFMSNSTLEMIAPYLDAINIDLKSFDQDFYQKYCGADLPIVKQNCQQIINYNIWLELTTLIIPDYTDDYKMLGKLTNFIKNRLGEQVPWHISAFSPEISWKMRDGKPTSLELLYNIYKIGKKAGLKYVYAGNVVDEGLDDTVCDHCKAKVIKRIGYKVSNNLDDNKCFNCQREIQGVFK
ncbi:MAG: AmmeMemoRadiSam system radical SAM enzyme [Candidatus Moranbacteria bacterium]|nr:AmmeMemoRadiSam system radical SAM enzyme [Candidatus Moranbacteria bacterium]